MTSPSESPVSPATPSPWRRRLGYAVVFLLAAALGVVGTMLLFNIRTRKEEAKQTYFPIAGLDESVIDPRVWGRNFPRQYDSYKRTVDIERTRHGGSETIDKLTKDPYLVRLYKGYAFSIDFREERGHAYMLQDQEETLRVKLKKQPGACLHCHAAVLPAYRDAGKEIMAKAPEEKKKGLSADQLAHAELMAGFEKVCGMEWADARKLVTHPVTCHDCHDAKTAQLKVTRPAFLVGIDALAKSEDPLPHLASIERWRKLNKAKLEAWRATPQEKRAELKKDQTPHYEVNREATRQEMRSFVCGQCHVEYYFQPETKVLIYPWANGLRIESIYDYYAGIGFSDWLHEETKAGVLKAQHPEFELWNQGTHARAGVSCADCHMPYVREGAVKVSDHWVRSPLLNMSRACQTCHRQDQHEMEARVELIQGRTEKLLQRAEKAVVDLIDAIKSSKAPDAALKEAREHQRKAQFFVDFVLSENSFGFHAGQESARILAVAIDEAHRGHLLLR